MLTWLRNLRDRFQRQPPPARSQAKSEGLPEELRHKPQDTPADLRHDEPEDIRDKKF